MGKDTGSHLDDPPDKHSEVNIDVMILLSSYGPLFMIAIKRANALPNLALKKTMH